jgi:hypothetical protein
MSVLVITAKCSDLFCMRVGDGDWREGYVPHGLGIGGGDYINLTIDMTTGRIANWVPLTPEMVDNAYEDGSGF